MSSRQKPKPPKLEDLIAAMYPDGPPRCADNAAMADVMAQTMIASHALVRHEFNNALESEMFEDREAAYKHAHFAARTVHYLAQSAAVLRRYGMAPAEVANSTSGNSKVLERPAPLEPDLGAYAETPAADSMTPDP